MQFFLFGFYFGFDGFGEVFGEVEVDDGEFVEYEVVVLYFFVQQCGDGFVYVGVVCDQFFGGEVCCDGFY